MRNSLLGAIAFFAAAAIGGYMAGGRSWSGVIYLTDGTMAGNSRTPAAIKRELDFSRLDGAELITATQKRLVTAARVIPKEGTLGVELGHFVTRGPDGDRKLACDAYYDRLSLVFEAEGVAEAGEKPMMKIDGPCQISSNDISSIEPIWIPVAKILETKPANADLDFKDGVRFTFEHMGTVWPVRWALQSVRLYNESQTGREISITHREMRELRPRPIVLNWLDGRRAPSAIENKIEKASSAIRNPQSVGKD